MSSAAGSPASLTRLSATGLANVTSGGGQVPAFVVSSEVNSDRESARQLTTRTYNSELYNSNFERMIGSLFGHRQLISRPARTTPSKCASASSAASSVALIADEASGEVAASIAAALDDVGAPATAC